MRILFITSSRVGDAVISCGILEQLRRLYPKARLTVACGGGCVSLFSRLPRVDRVINLGNGRRHAFNRLRLWSKLVGRYWDIAVDTRNSGITLFLAAGQRKRIGLSRGGPRYRQLADAMGFTPPPLPVVWTNAADHIEAKRRLPAGMPLIGLGPTAASRRKIWPAERYVEIFRAVEKLLPGCRAVIFAGGSDAERRAAAAIQVRLAGAVLMPAMLPLPLQAACMSRLRLFIGNDTGLLHLAAAAGAPTLGLFGRSRADEYAPAGLHAAAVEAPGPPGEAPMEGLSVDAVLAAIMPLLQAGGPGGSGVPAAADSL